MGKQQKRQLFVVLRIDLDMTCFGEPGENASEGLEGVTVTEVLPTAEEASSEAARLNKTNADKQCRYYWMTARYFPEGRKLDS